jgi:hypothetical protein
VPADLCAGYDESVCTTLGAVATRFGVSPAELIRAGVDLFRDLGGAGLAVPLAPRATGRARCRSRGRREPWTCIEDAASAWGLSPVQLHVAGGRLLLAIIYFLAVHEGA